MSLVRYSSAVRRIALALAISIITASAVALHGRANAPLTLGASKISIAGTSNVHAYSASTTAVRIVQAQLAEGVALAEAWSNITKPGVLETFEVAIPAKTLASPKDGLDKNMHKALKVEQHADITFRLVRLQGEAPALKAVGVLRIAGVEREVTLDMNAQRKDNTLAVKGSLDLLMTDYGITPPKAMLGMLKTDPKVTVTFEAVVALPLT